MPTHPTRPVKNMLGYAGAGVRRELGGLLVRVAEFRVKLVLFRSAMAGQASCIEGIRPAAILSRLARFFDLAKGLCCCALSRF